MADFNQARSQEVIYTLSHDSTESLELTNDPIGWDNDMKEFVSSDDYAGLISRFSTNLEFVKEAVDYMEGIYAEFGPEADIYLNKKIMHPTEMKRVQSYDAILDGYSIKREGRTQDRRIKINALGSTLLTTLKAKQNEKISIDSLETLDGTTLTPLTRQKVEFLGKKLLLVSKWEISEAQKQVLVPMVIFAGVKAVAIPLKLVAPSDDYVQDISNVSVPTSGASYGPGETGNMFYLVNDRIKTLDWILDIDMDYIGTATATFRLDLVTYTGGINYVFDNYQTLATASGSNSGNLSYNGVINVTDLPADASLALVLHITSANSQLLTFNTADLTQTEDSAFDPSINEALLPFEYINRKLQILTNRTDTVLHSPYFGRVDLGYDVDGPGAYQLITCGWWT